MWINIIFSSSSKEVGRNRRDWSSMFAGNTIQHWGLSLSGLWHWLDTHVFGCPDVHRQLAHVRWWSVPTCLMTTLVMWEATWPQACTWVQVVARRLPRFQKWVTFDLCTVLLVLCVSFLFCCFLCFVVVFMYSTLMHWWLGNKSFLWVWACLCKYRARSI